MPDPLRQTISATESAVLFGVSPYATPWMLYQRFALGTDIDDPENSRMAWGRRMQPLLLQAAADDLKLEIVGNDVDDYVRCGRLGCTRDGVIICPDRGPGAIETKVVFDYRVWMERWQGGKRVPPEYEIQLQQQMLVGDGTTPYTWGTFAVFVCGDMRYFERRPVPKLWEELQTQAEGFFGRVAGCDEPDPFGAPVEAALIAELFPTVPDKVLDLRDDPDHVKTSEDVAQYKFQRETENGAKRARETLQAKLFGLAKDNERVLLPCGVNFRIKKSGKGRTIDAFVPDKPTAAPVREGDSMLAAG